MHGVGPPSLDRRSLVDRRKRTGPLMSHGWPVEEHRHGLLYERQRVGQSDKGQTMLRRPHDRQQRYNRLDDPPSLLPQVDQGHMPLGRPFLGSGTPVERLT